MTSARARPRILATAAAACGLVAACGGTPQEPHGSPVLEQVYWAAGGDLQLVWSLGRATDMTNLVSPFVTEIDFVFDRQLDGSRLEDLVTMNGVTTAVPKNVADPSMSAIHVTWPGGAGAGAVALVDDYNSVPRFGGSSAYVFVRPQSPGLPAVSPLTFTLDTKYLTSAYGEAATVPADGVPVFVSPFAASIGVGAAPVVPGDKVPLVFSNRLAPPSATSPLIHVTANGADVPYKLLPDTSLSSRWFLEAADCLGGWPTMTTFTVTIDAGLTDVFGDALASPVSATFSTGPATSAPAASTCPIPDGGSGDAAADASPEGGLEAGSDTAVEAGSDAAAEASAGADAAEAGADAGAG